MHGYGNLFATDELFFASLQLAGTHPMTTPEDNDMAERIMKADPVLLKLLAERYGITDMDKVVCDTW
jgi:primary-amine oxidase